ncbi:MAG: hypothetical protein RMJ37_07540 [Spirochaetia bacterium]|nr:hypothetical protein [Spirochaetota bacterium]MCX8096490.1 hypothetical protein [Spirochaetota bacterium]MDW8113166.1 hypothetical protein [Spirochaetia bacterium]
MVYIYTRVGNGFGLGHYRRMKILENYLESKGIEVCIETSLKFENLEKSEMILIDARETNEKVFRTILKMNKPIVSLDDTITSKPSVVSILSLPYISTKGPKPNFEGVEYLIIEPTLKDLETSEEIDILVSFGGEDPYNLTEFVLNSFHDLLQSLRVVVFIGEHFRDYNRVVEVCRSRGFEFFLPSDSNFQGMIAKSRYVLTSFGITVYESLLLGKRVILVNATEYHHSVYLKSYLEGYGVVEVGFFDKDRNFVSTSSFKDAFEFIPSKKFVLNPRENLDRWFNIIDRIVRTPNKHNLRILLDSEVIYRDERKTTFLVGDREYFIDF